MVKFFVFLFILPTLVFAKPERQIELERRAFLTEIEKKELECFQQGYSNYHCFLKVKLLDGTIKDHERAVLNKLNEGASQFHAYLAGKKIENPDYFNIGDKYQLRAFENGADHYQSNLIRDYGTGVMSEEEVIDILMNSYGFPKAEAVAYFKKLLKPIS